MKSKKNNFTIQTDTPTYEGEAVELDAKTKAEAAASLAQQMLLFELDQAGKMKEVLTAPKNRKNIVFIVAVVAFLVYWFKFRKK